MYVRRLAIKNFRSHYDSQVSLFPVTVFVGPGAGGKSNLFDALINLSVVTRGAVGQAFSPYPSGTFGATRSWDAHHVAAIGFEVELCATSAGDVPFLYEFSYKQSPGLPGGEPVYQIMGERLSRESRDIFDRSRPGACALEAARLIADDRSLLAAIRSVWFSSAGHGADDELVEVARGISRVGKYRLDPLLLSTTKHSAGPDGVRESTIYALAWVSWGRPCFRAVSASRSKSSYPGRHSGVSEGGIRGL